MSMAQNINAEDVQQAYWEIKQDIEVVINEVVTKVIQDIGQAHLRLMKGYNDCLDNATKKLVKPNRIPEVEIRVLSRD